MFIPTTQEEARSRGWDRFDIILVSGDTYIDSPYIGTAVIGHVLMDEGYRVGIIAQPDIHGKDDITRLGEPLLFWGVSSGAVDSIISNYTATGKKRMRDDLTPGGKNVCRPDRAVIAYTNLIRQYFKNTAPIVIGGIEASLRRVAHYDCRDNAVRRSILFDAKADILVYGMGERTVLELAECLAHGNNYRHLRGMCYISPSRVEGYDELPSFELTAGNRGVFAAMYRLLYENSNPIRASGLVQKHGNRYLVHNPPSVALTPGELDRVHGLPYERDIHPYYKKQGKVAALDTIQFSITTHRGCFGGCNFCAIAVHQGNEIISRSEDSILREAGAFASHPDFKGIITDIGGPTANMYGMSCDKMMLAGTCAEKRCQGTDICGGMDISHKRLILLLRRLRKVNGIRKAFVASGIRHDLVMADREHGAEYLTELVRHHISGQLKLAPEHSEDHVLDLMNKPSAESLISFIKLFNELNKKYGKKQYLTYYFIAAHPGSTYDDMVALRRFVRSELHLTPEQVQVFTPAPSTWSTLMYYTGRNPFNGRDVFVERNSRAKEKQKQVLTGARPTC